MLSLRKHIFAAVTLSFATAGLASCSKFRAQARTFPFFLDGPAGHEIGVYKTKQEKGKGEVTYIPYAKLPTQKEVSLEAGTYFISNECSGFVYNHNAPSRLTMSRVSLKIPTFSRVVAVDKDNTGPKNIVQSECVDPIDGIRSEWKDRTEFYFLPGNTKFLLGGRSISIAAGKATHTELELFPLTVLPAEDNRSERFFVYPEESADSKETIVVSAEVGETLWLLPGNYGLEINGSRRRVAVERGSQIDVPLGILRIETPQKFQFSLNENSSPDDRQPIFAYINNAVLFNLNNDYSVFPGQYSVSLGGSDLKDLFLVEAGKKTVVKTRGAVVEVPPCKGNLKSCKSAPSITIHKDNAPFALMTVETGNPFLVLDSKFEFGVEGTRGILRDLTTSTDSVGKSTLARLRINWEVRRAEKKQRTDLVRVESRGAPNYGRTLDLLFHKPEEIYLPAGHYQLTYSIITSGAEPSKHRIDLSIGEGETREATVPIFPDRVESQESLSAKAKKEEDGRLPARLMPIRN